ncbi:MAG: AAA family ATPase [Bacteroidetes bacterium]|nr:MAG: AAA family ATPase [Bacteroidota bacterium]
MQNLIIKSENKIVLVTDDFHRYLFEKINFNNRLIAILGARGTGKTTMLLQVAKKFRDKETLYVALDDLFFTNNNLYTLADEFNKTGGELLLLDEVHKYPEWSREIKLIYDDFPDLQVIFTSSSVLDIYKGESDLSRRAVNYHLKELSFREYLLFFEQLGLPTYTIEEVISNHTEIASGLLKRIKPLKHLKKYYQTGVYPYYSGNEEEYYQALRNTINLILEIDIQSVRGIEYANIAKFKRLLYVLAGNVPFIPNISKLAEKVNVNRNLLIEALRLLERAELIQTCIKASKSISYLNKPDKIWLHNTNLNFAIAGDKINTGTLRETFFLQHVSVMHSVTLPDKGDFLLNNKYTFEVGGKNKKQHQIAGLEDAFIVRDDIELGTKKIIPLWLFGLIY